MANKLISLQWNTDRTEHMRCHETVTWKKVVAEVTTWFENTYSASSWEQKKLMEFMLIMKLEECIPRMSLSCSSEKWWTVPVNINNFRYEFYCFTYASLQVVTSVLLTTPFFWVMTPRHLIIGCRPFETSGTNYPVTRCHVPEECINFGGDTFGLCLLGRPTKRWRITLILICN